MKPVIDPPKINPIQYFKTIEINFESVVEILEFEIHYRLLRSVK